MAWSRPRAWGWSAKQMPSKIRRLRQLLAGRLAAPPPGVAHVLVGAGAAGHQDLLQGDAPALGRMAQGLTLAGAHRNDIEKVSEDWIRLTVEFLATWAAVPRSPGPGRGVSDRRS